MDKYNGWTNYETWNINLWMGESDSYYREMAQDAYDNAVIQYEWQTKDSAAITDLAEQLKDQHQEAMDELNLQNGPFFDLLGCALSEVNWYEIARHFIDEVEKETE